MIIEKNYYLVIVLIKTRNNFTNKRAKRISITWIFNLKISSNNIYLWPSIGNKLWAIKAKSKVVLNKNN